MAEKSTFKKIKQAESNHKPMEQALRERFQQYLDIAGVMFVVIDVKQNVVMINKKGCEILNYEDHEIIGKNWFDHFIKTENIEDIKGVFNQVMSGDFKPVEHYENSIFTKNGEQKIIAWHNSIIRDESGRISGTLSSGEDITERKKVEKALEASQNLLSSIIQTIPEIVYRLDSDGHITFISDSIKNYGYQPDELLGKPIFDIVYPSDAEKVIYKMNERRAGDRRIDSFEVRLLTKKNTVVPFEFFSISTVGLYAHEDSKTKNFIGTQGIARDITEKKATEEEREKNINELREALDNIKILEGMLPICAKCKKIRDDNGYWNNIEEYIESHSGALFSHGMCPECMDTMYKNENWYKKIRDKE